MSTISEHEQLSQIIYILTTCLTLNVRVVEYAPKQAELAGLVEKVRNNRAIPKPRLPKCKSNDVTQEYSRLVKRPFQDMFQKDDLDKVSVMAEWISKKTFVKVVSDKHKLCGCIALIKTDKSGSKFQFLADFFIACSDVGYRRYETSVSLTSCVIASDEDVMPIKKWMGKYTLLRVF